MREIVHSNLADARRVPWKNGRGVTTEVALWPPGSSFERGDYDWRISAAAIEAPGPFSAFPGFDRILVVTAGEGLMLAHDRDARRAHLRKFEPYRFSGDEATTAELVDGAVADFNVIARRGRARAQVQVSKLGRRGLREPLGAAHVFVHVLDGAATARITGEDEPFELEAKDSLWIRDARESDEIELRGRADECVAVLVRIESDLGRRP